MDKNTLFVRRSVSDFALHGNGKGGSWRIFTTISPIITEFFGISAHGVFFGMVLFSRPAGGTIGHSSRIHF